MAVVTAPTAEPRGVRRPPPGVDVALGPARRREVLVIGRRALTVGTNLIAHQCAVVHAPHLERARAIMRRAVFPVVVIDPNVAGQDAVAFVVASKAGAAGAWAGVPFVI